MTRAVAASTSAVRGRSLVRSRIWTRIAILALAAGVLAVGVPLFFAGSADRLADGTRIAGIDVGGMSPKAAQALLEKRSSQLVAVPVTFVADGRAFSITPKSMGVEVDWHAAVSAAARQGGGAGVVRGYRRLELQLFPQNVAPPIHSYGAAVDYELGLLAHALNTPHRQAVLVRHGLHITIAPGKTGRVLDRPAARTLLVQALAVLLTRARRASCPPRPAAGDGRLVDGEPDARLADHLRPGDRGRRPDAPARPALAAREAARPPVDAIRRPGR